ncbi:MAG: DUF1150 family protein [Proteobacteria bacterium]|nr:DUF1150 family protein [Pseudomonadota bacterium]
MGNNAKSATGNGLTARLRSVSAEDLSALGLEHVAYVKAIAHEGRRFYAVHSANGQQMAIMEDREVAFAAIRQNDMEPVSVH